MTKDEAAAAIECLRQAGKLKALPIGPVNWSDMSVSTFDGRVMVPYGSDGTWVEDKPLEEGDLRYLGSASHAGKIEFKCLYVYLGGVWRNILDGRSSAPAQAKRRAC